MALKQFPIYDGMTPSRTDLSAIQEPTGSEFLQVIAEIVEHQRLLRNRVYDFLLLLLPVLLMSLMSLYPA